MPAPTYYVRAGFLAGSWDEIGTSFPSWDQIVGNFRWEELAAGPVPDVDLEEMNIQRQLGTIFERLKTGECRVQMDNSRGQYTGTRSAQNLLLYSDDLSTYLTQNGANSLDVLTGKTYAIDADVFSEDATNGFHSLRFGNSVQVLSGQAVTMAAEFYAGTRDRFNLRFTDTSETHGFEANFSIRSMTVAGPSVLSSGTVIGASMQALTDGWVRVWISGTVPATMGRPRIYLINSAAALSYVGTGSAWIGIRALQASQSSGAINFVPTNGAAVFPGDTNIAVNDVFSVKAKIGTSVYNLFSGYVDGWGFNPALRDTRKIAITCSDIASRLRPLVTSSLMSNVTHRTILQAVMSEAAIDPAQYFIDPMNDIAAFAFLDQVSAGEAMAQVQQSGAQVYYVDGAGRLVMRNRHYDVTSTTAVGSFAAAFQGQVSLSTEDVMNRVEVRTTPREIFPDITTCAWITEPIFIPAASTRQFVMDYVDPFTNESGCPARDVADQVRGRDYVFNSAPTGEGSDMTSQVVVVASRNATSATITASNNGAGNGYLVVCQLYGYLASKQPEISRTLTDDASIAAYQERQVSIQADLLGTENRARGLAEFLLIDRSQPRPKLTWAVKNEWPACVEIDLLDRVFLSNSLSRVGSSFIVGQVEHTISWQLGQEHVLAMELELATIKNWFTLDSPTLGRLDYNILGA